MAQISFLYLLIVIFGMFCDFGEQFIMQWVGQKAMFDLRREMMARLQRLDLSFYDRNPVGRLVTRITTDVDALNELFSSGLLMILGDLLMLSFVIVAMLELSPGMTAFLLAVMPLVVLVTMQFRRSVQKSYRRIRVAIARINSYLQEHISGIAVLQLFNREARSRAEFEQINRDHMEAYKDAIVAYGWFYPIAEFLGMLALALLLAYGGFRVRGGALQIGVVVAFFQYGMRFFRPIQDLSEKYNIMQSAMAAAERVFKLLDAPVEIQSPTQAVPFPQSSAAVEFDHVWFAYKDEDWVLNDVSFRIEPGETIAVVGHTGAGKTTLSSLLLRFYEVQRGAIRIGGIDIREFEIEDLRRNFGVVLQDPHLFTGTIAENIRLGTTGISDDQLSGAAARVNLLDFVQTLPEGFDAASARAWRRIFHRPEAAHQFCPRSGPQPSVPHFGRSHFQRRHRNRAAHSRGAGATGGGPHFHRNRASPFHHPARRPHHRDAQGPVARNRHASGAARGAWHLLEAVPIAIQGSGDRQLADGRRAGHRRLISPLAAAISSGASFSIEALSPRRPPCSFACFNVGMARSNHAAACAHCFVSAYALPIRNWS